MACLSHDERWLQALFPLFNPELCHVDRPPSLTFGCGWRPRYDLLFKTRWEGFFISPGFSMIMVAVSAFIMCIALFARNQRVCLDGDRSTLTYGWSDVVYAYRETDYRFEEISEPELETHTWSDSPNSYDLLVKTRSGLKISFGDFESREKAQYYHGKLAEIISRSRHPESSREDIP